MGAAIFFLFLAVKNYRIFASVQNGGFHYITSHPPRVTPYSYREDLGFWDEVAEWLRRWTANPLCSARVGSNPTLVVILTECGFFPRFSCEACHHVAM